MNLGQVRLKNTLQWNDALDEQGICVFEIQVHDTHHGDSHELGPDQGTQLLIVVGLDCVRDRLGSFGAAHGCRFDIFDDSHVPLLVDLQLDVIVDAEEDDVGEDVNDADGVEDVEVFEGDLLRQLHHKPSLISISGGLMYAARDEAYSMMRRFELCNSRGQFSCRNLRVNWSTYTAGFILTNEALNT